MDKCLELDSWHTPATDYPEIQVGSHRIKRSRYRGHYYMYGIDDYLLFHTRHDLKITTLQELRGKRWHQWMVDDPPHWRAMEIYAEHSEGDVLCAGLGLGLIVHALARNPKVASITVVEQSQDVIDLISPHLPTDKHITIVKDDWYGIYRRAEHRWGGIIVDIWVANGAAEKQDQFHHEVLPMWVELAQLYPDTPLTFHGYQNVSSIRHTSPEMVKENAELMAGRGG